ncbi:Helix-turn-helix domain-containing protein [Paenibacillus algorifonticola]|uniref:Helix-turn-helix domain-containing protein n=1 Tax=Paenibacillus algorifonticola TaxID=684063 RepID=A0A1I1ZAL9_9BACL|nr:response regulator [Paenibacillus algorifonticola]SFE27563.1 Helix-turn-helix domain-containing protein [Paenibacillus algorifonticola]
MRKVMVVDDERWIRRGLIQMIPWEELGLELACEAVDGEEGYELALLHKPDLLFLDMRMPGFDGKELLGLLAESLPGVVTIVVSGYSDFEYTKEAIRHKAFDYLLKPLKREELITVLGKALALLDERDMRQEQQHRDSRKNWLLDVLQRGEQAPQDHTHVRAIGGSAETSISSLTECVPELPGGGSGNKALLLLAQPDYYIEQGGIQEAAGKIERRLQQSQPFYFEGCWSFVAAASPVNLGEIAICLFGSRFEHAEVQRLAALLQGTLREEMGTSYSMSAGSKPCLLNQLPAVYSKLQQRLDGRQLGEMAIMGFVECTFEPEEKQGKQQPSLPAGAVNADFYPAELEQAFLVQLQLGNEEQMRAEFNRFFTALAAPSRTVDGLRRSASMLVHALERQLQAAHTSLEQLSGKSALAYMELIRLRKDHVSVKRLFEEQILPTVAAQRSNSQGRHGEQLVREIQKLIELHYDQPLSLPQIAESRFLNADYVGRLFKKTTGSNFVDYLTDYRIAKATELMRYPQYKNYEIAELVGYEDYRYFSQIFKKKTGQTIGEYRGAAGKTPQ